MSEIGFGIPREGPLSEALASVPEDYRTYFRDGFRVLAAINIDHWYDVFRLAYQSTGSEATPIEADFEMERLGLDVDKLNALAPAVRLVSGVIALRGDTPEDFVRAAVKLKIIDDEFTLRIQRIADKVLQQRAQISQDLIARSLANKVLPSLTGFEIAIDVRLQIKNSRLLAAAPVALVRIDTDALGEQLWFQMTPEQAESMHRRLQQAVSEFSLASQKIKNLMQ